MIYIATTWDTTNSFFVYDKSPMKYDLIFENFKNVNMKVDLDSCEIHVPDDTDFAIMKLFFELSPHFDYDHWGYPFKK
jgi:hypothetical protein